MLRLVLLYFCCVSFLVESRLVLGIDILLVPVWVVGG